MSAIKYASNTTSNTAVNQPSASTIDQWLATRAKQVEEAPSPDFHSETVDGKVVHHGDRTQLGDAVQRNFATQDFLDAGKADGKWFRMSPETRARFIAAAAEDGEDGPAMLEKMDQTFDKLNAFMRRQDITDEQKISFLQAMMSKPVDSYDDDNSSDTAFECLGTVVAEFMAGNVEVLFNSDDLEVADLDQIVGTFEPKVSEWMKANEVSVKEDKSYEYMNTLTNDADAARKRRANMSPAEAVADIRRENAELRDRYENRPRPVTPSPETQKKTEAA